MCGYAVKKLKEVGKKIMLSIQTSSYIFLQGFGSDIFCSGFHITGYILYIFLLFKMVGAVYDWYIMWIPDPNNIHSLEQKWLKWYSTLAKKSF